MRKPRERVSPEIPLSSMADVAFLLIIFFMVTTSFIKTTGFKLEVPASKKSAQKRVRKNITVTLAPEKIYLASTGASRQVKGTELAKVLGDELRGIKNPEERIVVLECRNKVPYEQYIWVVDAIQKAGGILAVVEYE